MIMDRRSFLKGMMGISVAATVLPLLPPAEVLPEPFVYIAPAVENTPTMGTILRSFGRLGRVRIDDLWFPLEDASIQMFRRHEPLRIERDGLGHVWIPEGKTHLVNAPWQVQLWSPDIAIHQFFPENKKLDFEFDTRSLGVMRFTGSGYVTLTENTYTMAREDESDSALFSIVLEGDEKFQRYGESKEAEKL